MLLLLGACLDAPTYDGRPCGPGRVCPDLFTCHVGNVCRRACSNDKPCPLLEDVCVDGVCLPRDDVGPRVGEGGPCEGPERLCTMPPENECIGDAYRTYSSVGTCDTATMTCLYAFTDVPCTDCENQCRSPCAGVTCVDLEGGCRVNGRCQPDGVGGVECVYDFADDGLTCTKPDGGSGVCSSGVCGECSGDVECETSDLCVKGRRCVSGACVGGTPPVCNDPPDACHEMNGTCDPADGECDYAPVLNGTACDDGDMCTNGETCTAGVCMGGTALNCDDQEVCTTDSCNPATGCVNTPNTLVCDDGDLCTYNDRCGGGTCAGLTIQCNDDACTDRECNGTSQCSELAAANGSSCGSAAADRCCGGTCVDISSNVNHCGGCNVGCQAPFACESVSATSQCSSSPAATTGRCRCNADNNHCPLGQVCRTFTPYTNRCAPAGAANCGGGASFVDLTMCPNYCGY